MKKDFLGFLTAIKLFLLLSILVVANSCFAIEHLSYVQSPDYFHVKIKPGPNVFLAGSSRGGWRQEFFTIAEKNHIHATLFDPIIPKDKEVPGTLRLAWEVDHIKNADILLVWFPKGDLSDVKTLSQTSLFELGRFSQMADKPLVVGVDPDYINRKEIIRQLKQLRPEVQVVSTIEALALELKAVTMNLYIITN